MSNDTQAYTMREDNSTAATTTDDDDNDYDTSISFLTNTQEAVIAFLPILPALSSIIGSLCIIRLVFRQKFVAPYRRFLFGMSLYDILNSIKMPCYYLIVLQV